MIPLLLIGLLGNGALAIAIGNFTILVTNTTITVLPINMTVPAIVGPWHTTIIIYTHGLMTTVTTNNQGVVGISIGPIRPPPGPAGVCALVPGQGSVCVTEPWGFGHPLP